MKLSAPIYVLKSKAKSLKKSKGLTMTEALNQIAQEEGHISWSLLSSKLEEQFPKSYDEILNFLNPGDLVVVAARPGFGKTSFTIGLFVKAIQEKRKVNFYFSLSETHMDVAGRMAIYDESIGENESIFRLDYSDDISADYIIEKVQGLASKNSLIVIDYLQLLDEKRINPPVEEQIKKLKAFAKELGCIIIFLSQVNREIEYRNDKTPTLEDLRLPNPLDKSLFNKGILLFRKALDAKEVEVTIECGQKYRFFVGWDREKIKFL